MDRRMCGVKRAGQVDILDYRKDSMKNIIPWTCWCDEHGHRPKVKLKV